MTGRAQKFSRHALAAIAGCLIAAVLGGSPDATAQTVGAVNAAVSADLKPIPREHCDQLLTVASAALRSKSANSISPETRAGLRAFFVGKRLNETGCEGSREIPWTAAHDNADYNFIGAIADEASKAIKASSRGAADVDVRAVYGFGPAKNPVVPQ
jgi:hypothetical protein